MPKHKYIETPEKMWELFKAYESTTKDITIDGFQKFTKNLIGCSKRYFYGLNYAEFKPIIEKIKDYIFEFKLSEYKKGNIHHQKIIREASLRGITLNNSKQNSIIKNVKNNQFEIQNGVLTVSDTFLKKKSHTANHKMNKTIPDAIYVLNINGTNIYKIGVSQNHKRRIEDIRAAIPFSVDILLVKKCLFAIELEQSLHEEYKDFHIKNEWFKINNINDVLNKINK